jgi:DNA-binding XRE family transcriptional regulator
MLTAAQLRAARGLLDWTRTELAKAANISPETVKNIEHGTFRPQEQTSDAIRKAFAQHDVIFTENEGVQLKRDTVIRYEGTDEFKKFMDDVFKVASSDPESEVGGKKPICVSNVDDRLFAKHLGEYSPFHSRRMNELKKVKVRVLVKEKDNFTAPEAQYLEYRWNAQQNSSSVPFYVYGDKLAIITFEEEPVPKIVVIHSALVSRAYREQFEILWQNSKIKSKH